jgi:hypothetical protein
MWVGMFRGRMRYVDLTLLKKRREDVEKKNICVKKKTIAYRQPQQVSLVAIGTAPGKFTSNQATGTITPALADSYTNGLYVH